MKIILKKTGEEILMGTILHLAFITPIGVMKQDVEICMENLAGLQEAGIISLSHNVEDNKNQLSLFNSGSMVGKMPTKVDPIEQFKKTIAPESKQIEAINMDPYFYLDSFDETPATDALVEGGMEYLLLIHIAVLLDQRYVRNIKESKEIYWCNPTNGKIEQLQKKNLKLKSYNKFPAFRTKEDAVAALKLLSSIRKIVKANA